MKAERRIFSKRVIIVLSILLCAVLLTVSILGILLVRFSGPILFIGYGIVLSFQETLSQDRLLCRTDHQALLAECRELHKRFLVENADIRTYEYIKVPDSELSHFPLIRRLRGRVFASIKGSVSVELGDTFWHFGIIAVTEDLPNEPSANRSFGDKELIPGLWYYDVGYSRDRSYDQNIERLLKRNKYRQRLHNP